MNRRSEEWNLQHGRRHKTPPELLRQLLAVLSHWFPQRHFVCTADGNFATHDLTRFAARHRRRLSLVSRFYADAALYAPPPAAAGKKKAGRPRGKGAKQPSPPRWRRQRAIRRKGKELVAFSDALTAVRRWLWSEWIFATPVHQAAFAKIPPRLRDLLLCGLAPTA